MNTGSILTVAALSALVLSACTKKEDAPPATPAPTKYYKDSLPQNVSASVSARLGIQIVMQDNKDFMNEAEYLRILSVLDAHHEKVRATAAEIARINIGGGSTGISKLSGGRYEVGLAFNVSEEQIVQIFSGGFGEYKENERKIHLLRTVIPLTVVDTVGLKGQALDEAASKLKLAALSIDFAQASGFTTLILGSGGFTLNSNGMSVNIGAPADEIVTQIRLGIDARLAWSREVSQLIKELGASYEVAFQPGVFDGAEMAKVINSVRTRASLITALNRSFKTIVFGRRFDYDLGSSQALIPYDAAEESITKWFHGIEKPVEAADFEAPRAEIQSVLASRGYGLRVTLSLPVTQDYLRQARSFALVASSLDLQKLNITELRVGLEPTYYIPALGTLNVKVNETASSVNQYLSTYILKSSFQQSTLELVNYLRHLDSAAEVSLINNVVFSGSQGQNDRLAGFVAWFTRYVDGNKVNATKMTSLRLTDSGYETTFSGGILNVDLQTFDPARMGKILIPPK